MKTLLLVLVLLITGILLTPVQGKTVCHSESSGEISIKFCQRI